MDDREDQDQKPEPDTEGEEKPRELDPDMADEGKDPDDISPAQIV